MISYFKIDFHQQIYEDFEAAFFAALQYRFNGMKVNVDIKIYHYSITENFEKKLLTTIPYLTYKIILKINCFMQYHPFKDAEFCQENCIWVTASGKSYDVENMNKIHVINALKALQASANGEIIPLGWCGNRNAWIDIFKNVLKTKK
jgi:hypothetical protein